MVRDAGSECRLRGGGDAVFGLSLRLIVEERARLITQHGEYVVGDGSREIPSSDHDGLKIELRPCDPDVGTFYSRPPLLPEFPLGPVADESRYAGTDHRTYRSADRGADHRACRTTDTGTDDPRLFTLVLLCHDFFPLHFFLHVAKRSLGLTRRTPTEWLHHPLGHPSQSVVDPAAIRRRVTGESSEKLQDLGGSR